MIVMLLVAVCVYLNVQPAALAALGVQDVLVPAREVALDAPGLAQEAALVAPVLVQVVVQDALVRVREVVLGDVPVVQELARVDVADVLVLVRVDVLDVQELVQEVARVVPARVPGDVKDVPVALVRAREVAQEDVLVAQAVLALVQDVPVLVADAADVQVVVLTALEDVLLLVKVAQTQAASQDAEAVIVALDALDVVDVEVLQFQFHQLRNLKFYMVKKEK